MQSIFDLPLLAIELRYIAHEVAEPAVRSTLLALADAIDRHLLRLVG